MFEYRQVLSRMRLGDTDRAIARAGLMGRRKLVQLRRSSKPTSWAGSGAPSTPARRAGPRPSPPSGCWLSPDAAAAKCLICDGATSAKVRRISKSRRLACARCRSAKPRERMSPRCPMRATPTRSCFRATPKAGARTASRPAGARSAQTRSSAGFVCMTCAIPPQVRRLCREKVCRSSVGSSGTTGIAPRRATPTLPMRTMSKRRRRSE